MIAQNSTLAGVLLILSYVVIRDFIYPRIAKKNGNGYGVNGTIKLVSLEERLLNIDKGLGAAEVALSSLRNTFNTELRILDTRMVRLETRMEVLSVRVPDLRGCPLFKPEV